MQYAKYDNLNKIDGDIKCPISYEIDFIDNSSFNLNIKGLDK